MIFLRKVKTISGGYKLYLNRVLEEVTIMNEELIMNKVQGIFRDIFGDETIVINRSTNANDIDEWDSLKHISIIEAVQDEFNIKLSLDEIFDLTDVGKILDVIINEKD